MTCLLVHESLFLILLIIFVTNAIKISKSPRKKAKKRFRVRILLVVRPFTTRNVFLFGRGGRTNLRCTYTFKGRAGQERVRLRLDRIGGGKDAAQCSSSTEHDMLPGLCSGPEDNRGVPRLRIYISEVPEGTRAMRQHCICEELSYDQGIVRHSSLTSQFAATS